MAPVERLPRLLHGVELVGARLERHPSGKKKGLLTPTTFSLLHAVDFADRFERKILPPLRAGYLVVCDRYAYTAFVRDAGRGCDPAWVRTIYSFAPRPDRVFYFRVPVAVTLKRKLASRLKMNYYEAGMDLGLSDDLVESYTRFQGRLKREVRPPLEGRWLPGHRRDALGRGGPEGAAGRPEADAREVPDGGATDP